MVSAELLCCPLCGAPPTLYKSSSASWSVKCSTEKCLVSHGVVNTKPEDAAVERWNARVLLQRHGKTQSMPLDLSQISQRTKAESDYWVNQLRMEVERLRRTPQSSPERTNV